jgi:hypothetical protein
VSVQDNGVVTLTQDEWEILAAKAPGVWRTIYDSNRLLLGLTEEDL